MVHKLCDEAVYWPKKEPERKVEGYAKRGCCHSQGPVGAAKASS